MTRLLTLGLLSLLAIGCGEAVAQDPIEVPLSELLCASGPASAGEAWESAQWPPFPDADCTWMAFDGRQTYSIEHDLGRLPRAVSIYLSFRDDGRSSAAAAGDHSRIIEVREDAVVILNGTNQDFFLKVVLQ